MGEVQINRVNVGRISERNVANELEARGFRVSDLNKEGTSANADLIAANSGETLQVQVKGATWDRGWWWNYGYCKEAHLNRTIHMFNSASGFYTARIVVLVSVKSTKEYKSLVLPVEKAEEAAQLNLDHAFRSPKKDGSPKKPGKAWTALEDFPMPRDEKRLSIVKAEQELLKPFADNWGVFDDILNSQRRS
jgi:Holliday junction resolvase-like predicted endonuclease